MNKANVRLSTEIDVEKCAENIGGRFDLVIVAAERARELSRGSPSKTNATGKPVTLALDEIEQGKYTKQDFLNKIHKRDKE